MYRLLLATGVVALLISALLFGAQVRKDPPSSPPPPAADQQKAATPDKGVLPLETPQRRPGAKRVYLGVFTVPVEDMTSGTRRKLKLPNSDGVFVIEVMPDSPAEKAGLKHGDVITHVNGKLVDDEDELVDDLNKAGAGKQVDLAVIRDGKKQDIKAKLDEIPARALGGGAGPDEAGEEVVGMCHENAERIEQMERRIMRLEKRLSELEKTRSSSHSGKLGRNEVHFTRKPLKNNGKND
jgi:membrane-associated protease RseP (regulator of RpoE activity)